RSLRDHANGRSGLSEVTQAHRSVLGRLCTQVPRGALDWILSIVNYGGTQGLRSV
ncbi:hypothetical protein KI387_030146, partial [Taxus chinensis]